MEYVKGIKQRIIPWFEKKKLAYTTERCSFSITPQQVTILGIDKPLNETIQLRYTESVAYDDPSQLAMVFKSLAHKHQLTEVIPTAWLLSPDEYQLFLIDGLSVPPEEFQQALQWRVRSLISYPPEEATIDYFMLPAKKSASNVPMVAATVVKTATIKQTLDNFKEGEVNLINIYIPELALRNLTAAYETDERSTAMIYFHNSIVILNISSKKTLYFTRRINWSNPPEPTAADCEQLCLDLQRYFDYYQSQWRHPSPTRILVISQTVSSTSIATILSQLLATTVEAYSYPNIQHKQETIKIVKAQTLLLLGCALQENM